MSIKRKTRAPVISKTTRGRRTDLSPTPPRTTTPAPVPSATPPPLSIQNCLQQMDAKLESVILEASLHSSLYFIQYRTCSEHRLLGRKTNRTLQQSPLVVSSQLCRRILPKIPEYGPDVWFNADVELIADHLITSSRPKAKTILGPPKKSLQ